SRKLTHNANPFARCAHLKGWRKRPGERSSPTAVAADTRDGQSELTAGVLLKSVDRRPVEEARPGDFFRTSRERRRASPNLCGCLSSRLLQDPNRSLRQAGSISKAEDSLT